MDLFDLLPAGPVFSTFLLASLAVGAAPGPGMMFAVARGLGQGRLAGLISVLGLSAGSFLLCLTAAFGVAATNPITASRQDASRYSSSSSGEHTTWTETSTVASQVNQST